MRVSGLVAAAAVTVLCAASVQAGALFGSYDGRQQFPGSTQIKQMTQWLGKKQSVYHYYHSFCTDSSNQNWFFNQVLPSIWSAGSVPAITWTPSVCDRPDKSVPSAVVAGKWDAYLKNWAQRLRKFLAGPDAKFGTADDRRLYLSLGHEVNGDWESWSGNPTAYKGMWSRVRQVFAAQGLTDKTRLQWVYTANNQDVGGLTMEQYYPGDNLVDWLAVDGYNWGTAASWSSWTPVAQVFDTMLARFAKLSPLKPVGIWEVATTNAGGSSAQREAWIASLFEYVKTKNVKMVLWFNVDKETKWGIFGYSTGSSPAYKAALSNPFFVSTTGPRLLTDGQFTCRPLAAVQRFAEADAQVTDETEHEAEDQDEAEVDADAEESDDEVADDMSESPALAEVAATAIQSHEEAAASTMLLNVAEEAYAFLDVASQVTAAEDAEDEADDESEAEADAEDA